MTANTKLGQELYKDLVKERGSYRTLLTTALKDQEEAKSKGRTGSAQDIQKDIDKYSDKIAELDKSIVEFEMAMQIADEAELKKASEHIKTFGKDYNLRWIADMDRYICLKNEHKDPDKVNLVYKHIKPQSIVSVLNIWSKKPGCFDNFTPQQIRLMCEKEGLAFESLQTSFNKTKWEGGHSFNLMEIMQRYWVEINPKILNMTIDPNDECMKYNSLFDEWLYCLCGGKEENIWHTKEFVVQKLLYPERFIDSGALNPYYTGTPGGNGKGILAIILATLFTPMSIVMSRAKEMSDSFNSRQQGKIFNIIDEGDEGHISQAILKKRSGSEEIVIEGKGLEPVAMDRTESMIIFDNTGNTVELKGPGEDRRWSIMETNLVMRSHFVSKFKISTEEAAEFCTAIAEMGKERPEATKLINHWAYEIIQKHKAFYKKHGKLPVLVALHGKDYQNRLNSKKDTLTELFEDLFPVIEKHGFIPFKWLRDIAETKISHIKDATLSDRFDDFAKRMGYSEVQRTNGKIRVLWKGSDHNDEYNCKIRRIKPGTPNEFEFANISNAAYGKNIAINENMLDINIVDYPKVEAKKSDKMNAMHKELRATTNQKTLGL